MRALLPLLILAQTAINIPAPGTCGPWVPQTNGTKWRLCIDVQNQRYCELKTGRTIRAMLCP